MLRLAVCRNYVLRILLAMLAIFRIGGGPLLAKPHSEYRTVADAINQGSEYKRFAL